ncbi:hypothetical protein CJ179_30570 [Rhodococcus sp. ACS1]|nr:hypothetical protein CJ179_30570 [Rhodococcus sp. ACS1]
MRSGSTIAASVKRLSDPVLGLDHGGDVGVHLAQHRVGGGVGSVEIQRDQQVQDQLLVTVGVGVLSDQGPEAGVRVEDLAPTAFRLARPTQPPRAAWSM